MDTDREIQILCRNISLLRKKTGMTQKEMATLMGIGVSGVRKIESGVLPPRLGINSILALADAFSLSPGILFRSIFN